MLEQVGGATLKLADAIGGALYRPALALCLLPALAGAVTCDAPDGNEILCFPNTMPDARASQLRHPQMVMQLEAVGMQYGLPTHTLPIMAAMESKMGERSEDNGQGYAGMFQFGKAEAARFGIKGKSRHDRANSTVMAIRYAKANAAQLTWNADANDLYYAHQQGVNGYKRALEMREGKFHSRKLVSRLVNNLPPLVRDSIAYQTHKHGRWHLKQGVTHKAVARLYFKIWDAELSRLQ